MNPKIEGHKTTYAKSKDVSKTSTKGAGHAEQTQILYLTIHIFEPHSSLPNNLNVSMIVSSLNPHLPLKFY